MTIEQYVEVIHRHKSEICDSIMYKLESNFGPNSFNRTICKRDLCLIIDALTQDLLADSAIVTIKAGLSYIHAYNALKFAAQKPMILIAVEMLRETLITYTDTEEIIEVVDQRLEILYGIINEKTIQEVRVWSMAGKVLPYIALSGLVWAHLMGHETWYELFSVIIATVFFTISVTWWWWALYKITTIITILKNTAPRFRDISDRISHIRQDVTHIHNTVVTRNVDKSNQ